jgi:hypothetical protein
VAKSFIQNRVLILKELWREIVAEGIFATRCKSFIDRQSSRPAGALRLGHWIRSDKLYERLVNALFREWQFILPEY